MRQMRTCVIWICYSACASYVFSFHTKSVYREEYVQIRHVYLIWGHISNVDIMLFPSHQVQVRGNLLHTSTCHSSHLFNKNALKECVGGRIFVKQTLILNNN